MVSSGLIQNNDVSHFRLSIHLSLALFILCLIFWFILNVYKIKKFQFKLPISSSIIYSYLIVLQIILGAFLSGLDGGLIYNSWPDMNGSFFPNDVSYLDLLSTQLFNNRIYNSIFTSFYSLFTFILYFNFKLFFYKK